MDYPGRRSKASKVKMTSSDGSELYCRTESKFVQRPGPQAAHVAVAALAPGETADVTTVVAAGAVAAEVSRARGGWDLGNLKPQGSWEPA